MPATAAQGIERLEFRVPDEPEHGELLEDAEHWRKVYSELLAGFRFIAAVESGTHKRRRLLQARGLENRLLYWKSEAARLR